jgi:hypothetical protein
MTVLSVKRCGGKKAFGASFLLVSQNGNKTRKTPPRTSMAIILALLQWPLAKGASVSGSKMSDTPAVIKSRPKTSRSYHRFITICVIDWRWN